MDGVTELDQRLTWFEDGTTLFERHLHLLPDDDFRSPSPLEGWTFAHIVAHMGYNALALCNLVTWARTGIETPMYPSVEARARQIEEGAGLPAEELRALVTSSSAKLADLLRTMPVQAWGSEITTAQGRSVTAAEIPWMRCREVWVHSVDLQRGATFDDFPPQLVDALLDDIVLQRVRRGQSLDLEIVPSDRNRSWQIATNTAVPIRVTGSAAAICAWLAGRDHPVSVVLEGDFPPSLSGGWL